MGFSNIPSRCTIAMAARGDDTLTIVCGQPKDYTGTSVTNGVEIISTHLILNVWNGKDAPEYQAFFRRYFKDAMLRSKAEKRIVNEHFFSTKGFTWIEFYPAGTGLSDNDSFRRVTFTDSSPVWHSAMSIDKVINLIGTSLFQQILGSAE
ncbi:hypothetical protein BPA30113_01650 [Burkholderia paludis]|uniref:Uncharacterized protein n=2 Tax=Burkholderiaceae TaxID=119060 RepID=A0A6J5E8M7_9BURK|nr:hypothetical protein LMG30113_04001 [Burkholderia paludis]VWB40053.1 hypothetical protein BPA30113_01650 [Burkholderia paludis]